MLHYTGTSPTQRKIEMFRFIVCQNYVKTNVSRYNRALNSHGVKVSQLESMSEEAIA